MQPNDPSSFCLENAIFRNCFEQPTSKPKDGPKTVPGLKKLKKSGLAGIFSASLELTKQGLTSLMQEKFFKKNMIKKKN